MRSSIACSRCRRSKTKCDNNGIRDNDGNLAPCKSCTAGNRKCEYPAPTPAISNHSQRRESTATTAGEEAPPKKRKRPVVPTAASTPFRSKGQPGTFEDALQSPLLTPKVWDELWAIYEKHYSIEFPFLHKRTFLGPLQRLPPVSSSETGPDLKSQRPHDPALVLAFLALTSPFHAELVAQTDSSYDTAQIYAKAARKHLDHDFRAQGDSAMQQIQAFLMLGYHNWTACHSSTGYMQIKDGVNFALMKGYQCDEDVDKGCEGDNTASKRDRFIQQESRRRTFWSCFIIDRYLSVGRRRPKSIDVRDLEGNIQIPCSDKNFISGRAVKTRFFGESDLKYAERRKKTNDEAMQRNEGQNPERIEWEDREDDGMLGRYIFALEHFSDVSKWANDRGRRSEISGIGPWNPKTKYYHLDKRLREIKEDLPEELRLSSVNTENHIYAPPSATSRTYFMLHAVLMLSISYLAPEYLPTYGFRSTGPAGPLDAPLVTEPLPDDQPDYWVVKAKECFEYVRDFVNILQSYKNRGLVVESPFMGHAFFKAAWAAMYCHHVPKMDPSNALNSKLEPNAWDSTNQALDSMQKKFNVAGGYLDHLAIVKNRYAEKKRAWRNAGGSPQSTASDNDGGLHEYSTMFETAHKQFGSLQSDGGEFTHSNDKLYSKPSRLEHEEESEDPTTPHSPVVSFKTEKEEPRRSTSTATSVNSAFTPVNPNNASMPAQRESESTGVEGATGIRSLYGPPIHQGLQQLQPYSGQPLQHLQPSTYDHPSSAHAYSQSTSQYGLQTTYAQTSGPHQGSNGRSYDPQALLMLEREGNVSIRSQDVGWFELDQGPQSFSNMGYLFDQAQSQAPYMQNPQGPFLYPGPWSGQG